MPGYDYLPTNWDGFHHPTKNKMIMSIWSTLGPACCHNLPPQPRSTMLEAMPMNPVTRHDEYAQHGDRWAPPHFAWYTAFGTTHYGWPCPFLRWGGHKPRDHAQVGQCSREKENTVIRLAFQNIGRLPQLEEGNMKLEMACLFVISHVINIFAFTWPNKCWDFTTLTETTGKTRWWWKTSHCSLSFNITEKHPDQFQSRGTVILIINELLPQAMQPGDDQPGLAYTSGAGPGCMGKRISIWGWQLFTIHASWQAPIHLPATCVSNG